MLERIVSGKTWLLASVSGAILLLVGAIYIVGQESEERKVIQAAEGFVASLSTVQPRRVAAELRDSGNERARSDHSQPAWNDRSGDDLPGSRGLTPEAARELLAEHRQIRDVEQRSQACYDVIQALCRAGHAAEALALIDPEPGLVRTWEIEALFRNSGWSLAEATGKMKLLVDQGHRTDGSIALSAYLRSQSLADFQESVHSPVFKDYVAYYEQRSGIPINTTDNLASSYLAGRIREAGSGQREAYWRTAVDLHREGLISDSGLAGVLRQNSSFDAFEKWNAFHQGINTESGDNQVREVRNEIVRSMVTQDAEKALSEIARVESPQASAALARAAQLWMLNEGARGVNEWYVANKDRLIPAHRDALAETFLREALAFGERDTAQQWVNEVRDPRLKAECLTRLAEWDSKQKK